MKRKMLIPIILIAIILLNCILPTVQVWAADAITSTVEIIVDRQLYTALKTRLGNKATYNDAMRKISISQEEIANVTELTLANFGIDELKGIETFTELTYLDLSSNEISEETDLSFLNALTELTYLDLSSNAIRSLEAVDQSIIDNLSKLNLHNQNFDVVEVIEVDISEEADHVTRVNLPLPQILSYTTLKDEYLNELAEVWYTKYYDYPYIDWRTFDGKTVDVVVADEDDEYNLIVRKGVDCLNISIDDSEDILANSNINIHYIVVDSDETGVIFRDENLYKAVLEQLEEYQLINDDLESYDADVQLYEWTYDSTNRLHTPFDTYDPVYVIVIEDNDIINKIPSLILDSRQIEDLTGIQEFVGLKDKLDLSSNYIDDLKRLKELQENKIAKEAELRERVKLQISKVAEARAEVVSLEKEIQSLRDKIVDLNDAIADSQTTAERRTALRQELAEVKVELATAMAKLETAKTRLQERVAKLYEIYNQMYRLTNISELEMANLTEEEFKNISLEDARALYKAQVNAISALEVSKALLPSESAYFIAKYSIPTEVWLPAEETEEDTTTEDTTTGDTTTDDTTTGDTTTDDTTTEDTTTGDTTTGDTTTDDTTTGDTTTDDATTDIGTPPIENGEWIAIENPIKAYFEDKAKSADDWTLAQLKAAIRDLKQDEFMSGMYMYCTINKLYGDGNCACEEFYNIYVEEKIEEEEFYSIPADLDFTACQTTALYSDMFVIAGRLATVTDEEINEYVFLPRLKVLDLRDNLIDDLEDLEALVELEELYVGDNEIGDISNIDWSVFTELVKLDISFNMISDISPLNVISTLEWLDASKNLLTVSDQLNINDLSDDFYYLDLSRNQISDIEPLLLKIATLARAAGYKSDVATFIRHGQYGINGVNFQLYLYSQELEIITAFEQAGQTANIDLPKIFAQIEELQPSETTFNINSYHGNVSNKGEYAQVSTETLGNNKATVTIASTEKGESIGSGTKCIIYYTVLEEGALTDEVEPPVENIPEDNNTATNNTTEDNTVVDNTVTDNTTEDNTVVDNTVTDNTTEDNTVVDNTVTDNTTEDNTVVDNTVTDNTTEDNTVTDNTTEDNNTTGDNNTVEPPVADEEKEPTVDTETGDDVATDNYVVKSDYIKNVSPNTDVTTFVSNLNDKYTVVVVSEGQEVTEGTVATGMILEVYSEDKLVDIFMIVVKGDINGDGEANALDSGLLREQRAGNIKLSGAYAEAADVNNDGIIDAYDSKLILYHRAGVDGYIL